jgi:hypothetical protein
MQRLPFTVCFSVTFKKQNKNGSMSPAQFLTREVRAGAVFWTYRLSLNKNQNAGVST